MQIGQWVFKCNECEIRGSELDDCVLEDGSENMKMKAGRKTGRRDDNQEKGGKEGGNLSDLYVNFFALVWKCGLAMERHDDGSRSKKMGCGGVRGEGGEGAVGVSLVRCGQGR